MASGSEFRVLKLLRNYGADYPGGEPQVSTSESNGGEAPMHDLTLNSETPTLEGYCTATRRTYSDVIT